MMSHSSQSSVSLPSILVARFLQKNNYTETLDAFIREARLPANVGRVGATSGGKEWTIEGVLEEKKSYDYSVDFEREGDGDEGDVWRVPGIFLFLFIYLFIYFFFFFDLPPICVPALLLIELNRAPSNPSIIATPTPSNLLAASVEPWTKLAGRGLGNRARDSESPLYVVATSADRQVHLRHVSVAAGKETGGDQDEGITLSGLSESPILSYASVHGGGYILMTNMSGQLLLVEGSDIVDSRRDHKKYAVKVIAQEEEEGQGIWIATAGWDGKIFVYHAHVDTSASDRIGEPVAFVDLPTNPESIVFTKHPDSEQLILLASRRDSTHLYYYRIEPPSSLDPQQKKPYECKLIGKQNLAPHSVAWVAFSPSYLAISPHDPGLLAVATSTTPHMKVIIVRLLFPNDDDQQQQGRGYETHFSQAMTALSLQNREDAAILVQTNAFAPQTPYGSMPQVAWRPDSSGVWVNSEDGVIRGIETKTGKVTCLLKDGHRIGSKIRTIWSGFVDVLGEREEWLVTGGFDKRLVVWRV